MDMMNTNITGMIHIIAQITNNRLNNRFVCGLIRFSLDADSAASFCFAILSLLFCFILTYYMIALSLSILFTKAFANSMVIQHDTDWKKVAADVMPIGVEDCSALYT